MDTETPAPAKITVTNYLKTHLKAAAPEIARSDVGTAAMARFATAICKDLYDAGKLSEPIVVTRSKLESQIKIDGKKRLNDLSKRTIRGIVNAKMA